MPWFVLAATFAAIYARLLRGNLLEALSEDYIRTARAKGLRERRVVLGHGVRAAITPLVTLLGLDIGILLGGAILTETVFNIPGIGRLAYDAIQHADLPVIQGTVLFGAFFIILANLVVDIAYAFLDPRVRQRDAMTPAARGRGPAGRASTTDDGVVQAVDGVSLPRRARAGRSAIVGESGSGKSVVDADAHGPDALPPNAEITGRGRCSTGATCWSAPTRSCAQIRGDEIAMIFQDPLSSLHPFYTVGAPARRGGARAQRRLAARRRGRARSSCSASSASPSRRARADALPARALGRHAPARDDRDGARERARAC